MYIYICFGVTWYVCGEGRVWGVESRGLGPCNSVQCKEQRTKNKEQRTKNKEQRTKNKEQRRTKKNKKEQKRTKKNKKEQKEQKRTKKNNKEQQRTTKNNKEQRDALLCHDGFAHTPELAERRLTRLFVPSRRYSIWEGG